LRGFDLAHERRDIHPAMLRLEWPQPPDGLRQLALAAGLVAAARLIPGDDDVHEPLEEVLLGRLGGPPRVLERFVRREVLAGAGEIQAAL
jgi:hypothetical protein